MSTDLNDRDLAGRKRSHGDFLNQESCGATSFRDSKPIQTDLSLSDKENDVSCSSPAGAGSPAPKSTSAPSEAPSTVASPSPKPTPAPLGPSTTQPGSTMPKTTAQNPNDEPPKKKRLRGDEKKARDAILEAEKRQKQEEREKKRREKEEAEKQKAEQKAEQKAAKAADRAEKDQEKKQRQEEKDKKKREKEEEEAKKARSQLKLTSMFTRPATTPKKEPTASKSDEAKSSGSTPKPEAKETSLYEQMFKPFFIKENVRLANNGSLWDEETCAAKTKILDEYLAGEREQPATKFDPMEALQIAFRIRRGRVYPSVRKIMAELDGGSSNAPIDLTTESQNAQIRHTMEALKKIPLKSIKFREDVRPPYIGTISGLPAGVKSLQKVARRPVSKLLPLNYDYDSEAEWQEEEGEDVDDLDDDEEEGDLEEDMTDFLDDSEAILPARMGFDGSMEPESTGLCWEDSARKTEPALYKHRLEFILESLDSNDSINPFSTAYWTPPPAKPKPATATEPSITTSTSTTASTSASSTAKDCTMAPPPAPTDAFQALNPATAASGKKAAQPLPPDLQEKLKELVLSRPTLSKVGVIEWFAAENEKKCTRGQIKVSFEALFEKDGKVFKLRGG
ncbi:chromatin assembly factor 1 subunit rlf2 [Staphylotrichum tortipilum]|uniref:Chromatin assembly factor 1 subunit rlf2 n=1 Tax=Staphylotrichum tortipilum TaxID=2831512 RepID=A0AAN6MN51_9PEZI|nr:chromatin assembly factor 1 subunit rlf2 [Staphylotrichum longicolle]